MRIWLVRHGETEHNINGIFQGQLDTQLTEWGLEQARLTGQALRDVEFERIYASDLQRAYETARAIADGRDLDIRRDVRLRELHYGVLQGIDYTRFREVLQEHGVGDDWGPGVFSERGVAPPEGESLEDLIHRLRDFMEEEFADVEEGCDLAIVAHGGTIRTIMTELLSMPAITRGRIAMANCGVTRFARSGDQWTLELHNRVFWADDIAPTTPTNV